MPEDLVSGQQVPSVTDSGNSPFLAGAREAVDKWKKIAESNYNVSNRQDRVANNNRVPRLILSSEGFPSDIAVTYATPPMLSYLTVDTAREVKHVVLHSFGHAWHAKPLKGGWLNRVTEGEGTELYEHETSIVYVAKGSDHKTLTHQDRVAAGLQAALGPASRATPHFLIDRAGNLVVIGDVNNQMFISDGLGETSVSIMLEEAFYLVNDPVKETAVWRAEGIPPGTAGNVEYFTFSVPQLYTLSVLCKKLEIAYPNLTARNVVLRRRALTIDSASGYTIHDFIQGAKHVDVSPHFLTKKLWDRFFELVDTHTNIDSTNIWKATGVYKEIGVSLANAPVSDDPINLVTERTIKDMRNLGEGSNRSSELATVTKAGAMKDAGDEALNTSKKLAQVAASTYNSTRQTENMPTSLVEDNLPVEKQGGADPEDIWQI
jgi:hypothetical protein